MPAPEIKRTETGIEISGKLRIEAGPPYREVVATQEIYDTALAQQEQAPTVDNGEEKPLIVPHDALGNPITIGKPCTILPWADFREGVAVVYCLYAEEPMTKAESDARECDPGTLIWHEKGAYETEEAALGAALELLGVGSDAIAE